MLKLTVKVRGDSVVVDFAGSDPQVRSAINVPFTLTCASVYVGFRAVLGSEAPANQGLFAPIEVVAPRGCVVNPRFPAAVGARGMMLWRIIDMVFGALAKAIPDQVFAAGEGGSSILTYIVPAPDGGANVFVDFYRSGWGARPTKDGVEGTSQMAAGGAIRTSSAETIEREYPVIVEGFGFVPDTGGAGKYRGALSIYRCYRFLEDGRLLLRTCRTTSVPYGLANGEDGTPFRAVLLSNGSEVDLPPQMLIDTPVKAGDVLLHVLPGCGGYGPAIDREPRRVLEDTAERKLSVAYAERVYRVAIDPASGALDQARTARLRTGA
jgi:N-methylhydantoinase B